MVLTLIAAALRKKPETSLATQDNSVNGTKSLSCPPQGEMCSIHISGLCQVLARLMNIFNVLRKSTDV